MLAVQPRKRAIQPRSLVFNFLKHRFREIQTLFALIAAGSFVGVVVGQACTSVWGGVTRHQGKMNYHPQPREINHEMRRPRNYASNRSKSL